MQTANLQRIDTLQKGIETLLTILSAAIEESQDMDRQGQERMEENAMLWSALEGERREAALALWMHDKAQKSLDAENEMLTELLHSFYSAWTMNASVPHHVFEATENFLIEQCKIPDDVPVEQEGEGTPVAPF